METIDNIIKFSEDIEGEITYLRTDEGQIRLPRTVAEAIQMSKTDSTNIKDYIDSRMSEESGSGSLYTQRLLGSNFYEDEGYYTCELVNPFSSINIICSLLNDSGDVLVNNLRITKDVIKVTLEEPEDCWISISGVKSKEAVINVGENSSSHSHTNKAILDKLSAINGEIAYSGKLLATKEEIDKINRKLDIILERLNQE